MQHLRVVSESVPHSARVKSPGDGVKHWLVVILTLQSIAFTFHCFLLSKAVPASPHFSVCVYVLCHSSYISVEGPYVIPTMSVTHEGITATYKINSTSLNTLLPFPCLSAGVGCFGTATILIAQYRPHNLFTVLRLVDLEMLRAEQLEEVQKEMKLSQMLDHPNIACYLISFVVGSKLWAIQSLMHYGV